jgi:hypothetical protein
MTTQIFEDKFSMVDKLSKFVWFLVWHNCNEEHPMMNSEDLASELNLELVKGIQAYTSLPEQQLYYVLKRMLDNRVAELIHRFYGTHRKVEKFTISMEMSYDSPDDVFEKDYAGSMSTDCSPTPEDLYASKERVERTKTRLQPMARKVLDFLLNDDNNRLDTILRLSMLRAGSRYASPHINTIKPRHVAEAMGLSEDVVKTAFKEISRCYQEVIRE